MAKLIHSAALANIKASTLLWANSAYTQAALSALIFTDDGFIVAKGTEYQVALKSNTEGTAGTQRRLWSDGGTLKLRDSARFTYTGPRIDQVRTDPLAVSSTMYLTGSVTEATVTNPVTDTLKIKNSVYVTTDSAGNATLTAPGISVTGGASNFELAGQTLEQYINSLVISGIQTNDAMVFAGTLKVVGNDLVFVSHNENLNYGITITNGTTKLSDITKYSAGWTFKIVTNGGHPTGFDVLEVGDMLIATSGSSTTYSAANFSAIQANIDGAVTASNTLTENGLLLGGGGKTINVLTTANTSGYLKPNGSGAPVWSSFGTLTLDGDTADFTFTPDASKTLVVGKGLDITSTGSPAVFTLGHKTTVTAQSTAALKKFAFDAYGHITEVADVAKLTLKAQNASGNSVNTNGVSDKTYDGSTAVDFILKAGNNITLSQATSGVITISSAFTNTWRPVYAWLLSGMAAAGDTIDQMLGESITTKSLAFSSTFGYHETTHTVGGNTVQVAEVDLVWADVDSSGNISYSF